MFRNIRVFYAIFLRELVSLPSVREHKRDPKFHTPFFPKKNNMKTRRDLYYIILHNFPQCVCVSLCLCVSVSVCLCVCMSVYLCICVSAYLRICVSAYLCVCVDVFLCILWNMRDRKMLIDTLCVLILIFTSSN